MRLGTAVWEVTMRFGELAWGAFVFNLWNADSSSQRVYHDLISDREFLHRLPVAAQPGDLAKLREFLTQYGVHYAPKDLADQYAQVWPQVTHSASGLISENLLTCDLAADSETAEGVKSAYGLLQWPHVWGGDTSASKVAHFLNPALFVMWDNIMQGTFGLTGTEGYLEYLRKVRAEALEAVRDFEVLALPGTPETYLSEKLGYATTRPFTKLLDDFYWVTITHKRQTRPPEWLLALLTA